MESAAFGTQLHRGDGRRIVQKDLGLAENIDGFDEESQIIIGQFPGTQLLRVDPGLLGDKAVDQLFIGHLQGEHGDALFLPQRCILEHLFACPLSPCCGLETLQAVGWATIKVMLFVSLLAEVTLLCDL